MNIVVYEIQALGELQIVINSVILMQTRFHKEVELEMLHSTKEVRTFDNSTDKIISRHGIIHPMSNYPELVWVVDVYY